MDRRNQCLAKVAVYRKLCSCQGTFLFHVSEWGRRLRQLLLHRPDHGWDTGGAWLDVHCDLCRPSDVCKVSIQSIKNKTTRANFTISSLKLKYLNLEEMTMISENYDVENRKAI